MTALAILPASSPTRRPRATLARKALRGAALLAASGLLAGCNMVVMNPAGDVAVQQRNLIVASTALDAARHRAR